MRIRINRMDNDERKKWLFPMSTYELELLHKWLGKMVDRGDLLEELVEDNEEQVAYGLYDALEQWSKQ